MNKQTIDYNLTPNKNGTRYFAHIVHNACVDAETAISGISEAAGINIRPNLVRLILSSASTYLAEQLALGNCVIVGDFRVGLAIEGTFDSANATFDPKQHRLKVIAMPRKAMQRAIKYPAPVNVTVDGAPILESVWGASHVQDVLVSGGNCEGNGRNLLVGSGKGIDRIWIETADGEVVAVGEVRDCDAIRLSFALPAGIASGEYTLVAERPNEDGTTHSRVRRKVSVV